MSPENIVYLEDDDSDFPESWLKPCTKEEFRENIKIDNSSEPDLSNATPLHELGIFL